MTNTGAKGKVSVIMNCFNCGCFLREAIDSVMAQTYTDWEIILWDNASTENIQEFLGGYDNRLRYFRGDQTVPLGEGRNLALEQVTGSYIAFLDCDDIWLPEKLALSLSLFTDDQIGLVYTDWTLFNSSGYAEDNFGNRKAPEGWVFEQILFNNFTCLSTLVVRAGIVQHGLRFDTRFSYLEDSDFLVRIARSWKFGYVPKALTRYRMHANSASANKVHAFREEMFMLIDKCSALYPDVQTKYAASLRALNTKDSAIDNWRLGKNREARSILYPQLPNHKKYFFIYLAMFFPFGLIDWLRQKITRRARYHY